MSTSMAPRVDTADASPGSLSLLTLLRHNRIVREWRLLLLAAGNVGIMGGMRVWRLNELQASGATPQVDPLSNLILATLFWLPVCMLALFALRRPRYPAILLSLPVSARRLWSSHVLGLLLAGGVSLTIAALLFTLIDSRWSSSHELPIPMSALAALPAALAMLLVATAALAGTAPALTRIPATRRSGLFVAAGLLAWLAATMFLLGLPPAVTVVVAVLATARLIQVGRGLGPALSITPLGLGSGVDPAPARWQESRAPRGRALNRGLFAILLGEPKTWLLLAILGFYGILLSGLFDTMDQDGDSRINYVPLTWYLLVIAVQALHRRLRVLDALPVSRRRLAALLVGTPLMLTALGFITGAVVTRLALPEPTVITFAKADEGNVVRVLPRYFAISRGGESPLIEAPWGETAKPRTTRILPLLDARLYNPWTTEAGSSPRFVAWQLSRAAKTLLGVDLDPGELEAQALTVDADGFTAPRDPSTPILGNFTGDATGSQAPYNAILALIVIGPTLLLLVPILGSQRASVSETRRRWILWGTLGGVFALWIPFFVMMVRFDFSFWTLSAVLEMAAGRAAAMLPGGGLTLGGLVLAALALIYLLYQRTFLRMEYVPGGTTGDCS